MHFTFTETELPGVFIIDTKQFEDDRGFFIEAFKKSDFQRHIRKEFVQSNHSFSKKGVIRGLHYQDPFPQGKLLRVPIGRIIDVAVDIRKVIEGELNPNYLKYVQVELSGENHRMLWIPEGFAHGFETLEDTHLLYMCTNEYHKEGDSGVRYDDPAIGINWQTKDPIVSDKDKNLGLIKL